LGVGGAGACGAQCGALAGDARRGSSAPRRASGECGSRRWLVVRGPLGGRCGPRRRCVEVRGVWTPTIGVQTPRISARAFHVMNDTQPAHIAGSVSSSAARPTAACSIAPRPCISRSRCDRVRFGPESPAQRTADDGPHSAAPAHLHSLGADKPRRAPRPTPRTERHRRPAQRSQTPRRTQREATAPDA
jgi:hypothetical protein